MSSGCPSSIASPHSSPSRAAGPTADLDDIFAEEVIVRPYDHFARLRDTDPVHWNEKFVLWVVTGYDPVVRILRHHEHLSPAIIRGAQGAGPYPPVVPEDAPLFEEVWTYRADPLVDEDRPAPGAVVLPREELLSERIHAGGDLAGADGSDGQHAGVEAGLGDHELGGPLALGGQGPAVDPQVQAGSRRRMYKYEIILYRSNEDQVFVAEAPELPGCMAHGDDEESALRNVKVAMQFWNDWARELGRPVPEPEGERLMLA